MAEKKRPNILVLWGDDIGYWNVSLNNRGMMGYRTPNIDRIGEEGVQFTDYYGQQSCTAGRAAFITGQNPVVRRKPAAIVLEVSAAAESLLPSTSTRSWRRRSRGRARIDALPPAATGRSDEERTDPRDLQRGRTAMPALGKPPTLANDPPRSK